MTILQSLRSAIYDDECRPITIDFDDAFGEGFRRLLWQVVTDAALDGPVRISARKFLCIGTGIRMWSTVGIAFECNGRHRDGRTFGQPLLQSIILRLAFSQIQPPAVVMDH